MTTWEIEPTLDLSRPKAESVSDISLLLALGRKESKECQMPPKDLFKYIEPFETSLQMQIRFLNYTQLIQ